MVRFLLCAVLLLVSHATGSTAARADDAVLWQALRSPGHIALLRHALAPGTGDPEGFLLRECATQRNLSDGGRGQAKRIGARLRGNGVMAARVMSSQWCRCLETARLLGLGDVTELPALNSFFESMDRQDDQMAALLEWIKDQPLTAPVILVTHQVNISALTGIFPASGELMVLQRTTEGNLAFVGTIETD
jgi:broad specificity phosphatase PhoE